MQSDHNAHRMHGTTHNSHNLHVYYVCTLLPGHGGNGNGMRMEMELGHLRRQHGLRISDTLELKCRVDTTLHHITLQY
jgi:hypothetical protein